MGNCFSVKPESVHLPQDLNPKDLDSFVPPVNSGRVIKVYDGDTITVASKVPGLKNSPIYKFSVRLNGIDTPEIKGKNKDEKEIAQKARDALSGRIMGKDIFLKNVQTEKYGRLLCEIYLDKENLNQWMIKQRYALAYDGGTKVIPKSWKNYHENNII
jgi:micrococcal nuclease